jgi:Tub family
MSGRKAEVEYQSNIAGQAKPRDFTVKLFNEKEECVGSFRNVKPKYDEKEEIYHMNFFGRVKQASARNFQLVSVDDPEAKQIVLMHGKVILFARF